MCVWLNLKTIKFYFNKINHIFLVTTTLFSGWNSLIMNFHVQNKSVGIWLQMCQLHLESHWPFCRPALNSGNCWTSVGRSRLWRKTQFHYNTLKIVKNKHSSLFSPNISAEEKSLIRLAPSRLLWGGFQLSLRRKRKLF